MSKLVSIHSFQVGSGKSQIASNVAVLLASQGQRVALVDANVQSPSANAVFGLQEDNAPGFESFLLGSCTVQDTVRDVSYLAASESNGRLFVVSTGSEPRYITQLLRGGIPGETLKSGLHDLDQYLQLDTLIVDTAAGLNENALLLMAMTTSLGIVMLLDQRDYQGTGTTVEIARKLSVPHVGLIVNDVPSVYVHAQVKDEVQNTYGCPATVMPHSDELMALGGRGIFVLQYPDHPVTRALEEATAMLMA